MCTFNGERFLGEQLRSILSQTVLPDEIVILDDGSADHTIEIIESFIEKLPEGSPRVRLIRNSKKLGVTKNFESAISATTGDIIFLSDQDDVWSPTKVEQFLGLFEANPQTTLIFSDANLIDADGARLSKSLFGALKVRESELDRDNGDKFFQVLLKRNIVTGATVAFRRSVFAASIPFPESWLHDEWLAIIAASQGHVMSVDARTIEYRQHDANVVGILDKTPGYWFKYFFASRAGRYAELDRRNQALVKKLKNSDMEFLELAKNKSKFDLTRANYPKVRFARIAPVVKSLRCGDYALFASNGVTEAIRDLTQSI